MGVSSRNKEKGAGWKADPAYLPSLETAEKRGPFVDSKKRKKGAS